MDESCGGSRNACFNGGHSCKYDMFGNEDVLVKSVGAIVILCGQTELTVSVCFFSYFAFCSARSFPASSGLIHVPQPEEIREEAEQHKNEVEGNHEVRKERERLGTFDVREIASFWCRIAVKFHWSGTASRLARQKPSC